MAIKASAADEDDDISDFMSSIDIKMYLMVVAHE